MNLTIKKGKHFNILTDAEMVVLVKLVKNEKLSDEEKKLQQRIIKFLKI